MQEIVAALSGVQTDFLERIITVAKDDSMYQKLVKEVQEGVVRRYWLEDGLIHSKGNMLFVPKVGGLRRELLKETHDTQWAGHPGRERMYALLSHFYYWPNMEDEIEAYVKTCGICQLDKPKR